MNKKLIAPANEKEKLWCNTCIHLSTSRNFCLKGAMRENCPNYKYDKGRELMNIPIDEGFFV